MTIKRIHVNQHVIRLNKKHGSEIPCCTVKEGSTNRYAREVKIHGPSSVVYRPDKPLNCGAVIWVETEAEIELVDEKTFGEIEDLMYEVRKQYPDERIEL